MSIGFLGLLTLLFIFLKLTDRIAWSWFWVLSPSLLPGVIFLFVTLSLLVWGFLFGK